MAVTRYATYQDAEAALYRDAGVDAGAVVDHGLTLGTSGTRVRVREVGEGDPLLFLHGMPNSGGTWAYLVARLADAFRCFVLDAPGTGLSDPLPQPLTLADLDRYAAALVVDVLDGLGIERIDIVASSFGGMIAMRSAVAAPERVGRMVLMGAPALAPGSLTPVPMRLMGTPLRHLLTRLPASRQANRSVLRQVGHAVTLDAGTLPSAFEDWYLALMSKTATASAIDGLMAEAISWRGLDPDLFFTDAELAAVTTPTHFVWGEDDGFGGADVARRTVAPMPKATLELWPGSGHLPWLDDPARAAVAVREFLAS